MKFINFEPQEAVELQSDITTHNVSLYFEFIENGLTYAVNASGQIEMTGDIDMGDYVTAPYSYDEIVNVTAYEPEVFWKGDLIDRKNTSLLLCHIEKLLIEHCS